MKYMIATLAAGLVLGACEHTAPSAPEAETAALFDETAIASFAVDQVYTQHPTRALVDVVDVTPGAEPGHYLVHVEMTGSAEFRNIFDVVVSEGDDGDLTLVTLDQVQGS
jgi:hypothetical protein